MTGFLSGLAVITLTTGALIALLLLFTPAAAKRFTPRWRYWVWLVLALRLAVPIHISLPDPPVAFPLPTLAERPRSSDMLRELEIPQETPVQPLPASTSNGIYAGNVHTPILDTARVTVVQDGQVQTDWVKQVIQWPNLLFFLWCAGAAFTLSRELLHHWAFLRLCRRWRRPAEPELQEALGRKVRELGLDSVPRLYRCAAISTPMLAGLIHPLILLPLGGERDSLPMALDHELTHLKRNDLWYKLLLLWVRVLHWFNPLVWLMCRRAEGDLEQCCDYDLLQGRTLADRKAYGAALLDQMAAGCSGTRLTTGFSGGKREVMARFRALLDTSAKKRGGIALAVVVLAAVLASVAVGFYGAPSYDTDAQQYRNPKWGVQMDVPQELWDQLEVIEKTSGGERNLYFVSRALKETLPDFDLSEDYWVVLYGGKKNLDNYAIGYHHLEAVRDRYAAAGASAEELEALEELYQGAQAAMTSISANSQHREEYDGVFRWQFSPVAFEVPIPESLWDQLFCVMSSTDEFHYVSLVSTKLAGLLEDFDPAEDYWLQVRFWKSEGEYLRAVYYGTWNYRYEFPFMKDGSGELNNLIALYAAAPDVYRNFVFLESEGGSIEQLTGDAYDRERETYINYNLKFQVSIPSEVYERLDIYYTTPYQYEIYDTQSVYFVDRTLAEGFDMEEAEKNPIRYLDENYPDALYLWVDLSYYPSGTQELAAAFADMPGKSLISGNELFPDAESIPVYRLDGTQIRSFHPDTYDRETALYTNYKLGFRLSIPNEIYDRLYIHTTDSEVSIVGAEGGETVHTSTAYFLDRSLLNETGPDLEDQITKLIGNRNVLLVVQEGLTEGELTVMGVRNWTGENRNLYWFGHWAVSQVSLLNDTDPRQIVRYPGRAAQTCPDGEYQALRSGVQYFAGENMLEFLPLSEGEAQDAYRLPLAQDVVLTPMGNVPEGVEVTPEYVINSMVVPGWSSHLPILNITVKNGEITALTVK